jgi:hypothetical protein
MEEDRRGAIRWQVSLPVRYYSHLRPNEGCSHTQDLSTLGAKLAMVEKHRVGDQLSLVLDIPDQGNGPVCFDANVVWQRELDGLEQDCKYMTGIEFRRIRDCHKKSILGHVSKNFPNQFVAKWWEGIS